MTRACLPMLAFLAFVLLPGCSESRFDLADTASASADTGGGGETSFDMSGLRLDIYPSDVGPSLGPQSYTVPSDSPWQGLDVPLEAPITLRGTVTGFAATPPSAITVPGEDVGVIAQVSLLQENSIAGAATSSTESGTFSLQITPGDAYQLSVVPLDPTLLPFVVSTDQSFTRSGEIDADLLSLGYGVPVYGLVRTSDGAPLPRTEVSLLDPETGVAGPSVETDGTGYYLLRSQPGTWTLQVAGLASRAVPTVLREVEVDPVDGLREDVDMGEIAPVPFGCEIVDEAGNPLSDVTVRLTATSLANAEWSLVRETNPDGGGDVLVRLLPGTYTAEFIPPYDSGLSPASMSLSVSSSGLELQSEVVLSSLDTLSGRVVGPSTEPLGNVVVAAHVIGFDQQIYSGTSDANGTFTLQVPAVPLELTFTPPGKDVAIYRTGYDPSTDTLHRVTLTEGYPVSGILRADGEAVPYAVVEIHNADDDTLLGTTLSGEDGSFAVRISP